MDKKMITVVVEELEISIFEGGCIEDLVGYLSKFCDRSHSLGITWGYDGAEAFHIMYTRLETDEEAEYRLAMEREHAAHKEAIKKAQVDSKRINEEVDELTKKIDKLRREQSYLTRVVLHGQ